jgi:methyl coenzyme M reductase alpha subunit
MDFNYPTNSFYRDIINIKEYYEVEYWAKKFGVNPVQLKEAVQAVGPLPKDVEQELSNSASR